MRVLIDATSVLLRSAGVKSYTYHWIQHLRAIAGRDEFRAFPFVNNLYELNHESSVAGPLATIPRLALLHFVNTPGNPAMDWLMGGADVFHVSNQIRYPPRRTPITATIHDLTCWIHPELHTAANVRADESFAARALKRAVRLIAVSENSKRDAVRVLGIHPDRIDVIYSGVSEAYFEAQPSRRAKPYALFVGTIEPRKNVDGLLDAWAALPPELRAQFDLVIAGPLGWASENTVRRLQSAPESVHYLGYVAERDLPALTAGAAAFVYPSLYEGFGFPVAQAMACGVPVITSDNSCLPEVAGGGAIYVDPRSPAEIAAAFARLLPSADLRVQLGAAGRLKAADYRWDRCARQSLEFFRKATA